MPTIHKSCPCPVCFKCCCDEVEFTNPHDCVNSEEGFCTCNDEPDGYDGYDDSMDGDHESALASAGFGTDEDYGCFDSCDDF